MKKLFALCLVFAVALTLFVSPAFAAETATCPNCGGQLTFINFDIIIIGAKTYKCSRCGKFYSSSSAFGYKFYEIGRPGSSVSDGSGSIDSPKKYYTKPSSTSSNTVYNGGDTSYYSVVNTQNKTLNFTTYNQTTQNYINNTYTYNNYTYNNEYNYYTYNISNHNYYVTNNYTYVTVVYPNGTQNEDGEDNYDSVDIYYELPDGRNSYDLSPEDIYGTYFVYNVLPYQSIPEDDGVTLGLWHYDGDLKDSSANNGQYYLNPGLTNFSEVDDTWGSCLLSPLKTSSSSSMGIFYLFDNLSLPSSYTFEFRLYLKSHSYTAQLELDGGSIEYRGLLPDQWNSIAYCYDGSLLKLFVNGVFVKQASTSLSSVYLYCNSVRNEFTYSIDEVRLSNKVLYTDNYLPSSQPFDTNEVLVPPSDPVEYDIGIFSGYDVPEYRIGGVRPTYPTNGFVWVYLEDDVVQSVQQYQTDGWYSVDARIYVDGEWRDVKGFNLADAKFEEVTPEPTPTPDPGGEPTPTPDPGGEPTPTPDPGGGEIDPSEPGWFEKFLSMLFDGLSGLFQTISVVLGSILTGIIDLLGQVVKAAGSMVGLGQDFTGVIGQLFGWLPAEMQAVLVGGFALFVTIGLIKIFMK